jgi:tetratricopeptide (TPR) repeat protein
VSAAISQVLRVRLLRAVALARAGRYGQALMQARRALTDPVEDGLALIAGAAVRFVARDYQGALDDLDRALALDGVPFARIIEDRVRFASSLGWDQEVLATLQRAMREQPDEPRWFALATQSLVRGGAHEQALETALRAVELEPDSVGTRLEIATLLIELGRYEEAAQAARAAALQLPQRSQRHAFAIASILRGAGDFAGARQAFERASVLWPSEPLFLLELAELASWSGEVDEAIQLVERASSLDSSQAGISRIRGVAEMLAGAPGRAVPLLDAALEGDPSDAPTLIWRAEAAYRLGDDAAVHQLLSRATMRADGYLFVAWMLRLLVVAREGGSDELRPGHVEEFREAVLEIVPQGYEAFATRRREAVVEVLELALERMRGNRTTIATFVDESGALRRVRARSGVRFASRHALQLIRVLPPDQVIEALDDVVARYPTASLPICHRGELYLWLGDLARARADLEAALRLNPFTRWAYIGLTGIDLLRGDPETALRTCANGVRMMSNTEGPAVYVYRGEAYRLLGRFEEARADLEKVVALTPTRIGAWVDLALLYAQMEDDGAFERAWDHLERAAPGLLSDASREVGVTLWVLAGELASRSDRLRVLEHALVMMRGNRSTSCATYFTREGALRFVQPHADPIEGPHVRDGRILDRAQALLGGFSGFGELSSPRASPAR